MISWATALEPASIKWEPASGPQECNEESLIKEG
jgi:hypothetical protein